jgi:diguanylate cyclase (GGDEF)-like protein
MNAVQQHRRGQARIVPISTWALWGNRLRVLCYVLSVDLAAMLVIAVSAVVVPFDQSSLVPFAALMTCAVLYTEASRSIEQARAENAASPYVDLNSVWMFAAVVLLHPAMAAAVIATSYTYRWLRVRHHPVFRLTFTAAGTMLSGQAAAAVVTSLGTTTFADMPRDLSTFLRVTAAGLLFLVINFGTVLGAITLAAGHPTLRKVVTGANPSDYALEAATIALGLLLAWALTDWPFIMALIVIVTLVLHRNVLIHQFRENARIDAKTGLLNAAAWTAAVDTELERAARLAQTSGVLVIDLDHFKSINDKYGHLAGDEMLRAVAGTLTNEVRASDLVGRFGGEEFVVLLPGISQTETRHVAERIRRRISELVIPIPALSNGNGSARASTNGSAAAHSALSSGTNGNGNGNGSTALFRQLTVSIGIAVFPEHGQDRSDVLHAADMAMYAAKAAGRNRVHEATVITR